MRKKKVIKNLMVKKLQQRIRNQNNKKLNNNIRINQVDLKKKLDFQNFNKFNSIFHKQISIEKEQKDV
jgi:hypothetical protein